MGCGAWSGKAGPDSAKDQESGEVDTLEKGIQTPMARGRST